MSYATGEGGVFKKVEDHADGSEEFFFAEWEDVPSFEPWNREPDVSDRAWRKVRRPRLAARGKQAWGEKLRGGTEKEYMEVLRNAPRARKEYVEGGKRTMDVEHKDRGTTVARKTIIYKRDGRTVQSESYLINPNYLDGGDESQRGW